VPKTGLGFETLTRPNAGVDSSKNGFGLSEMSAAENNERGAPMQPLIVSFISLIFSFSLWASGGVAQAPFDQQLFRMPTAPNEIKVMTYNVENLFDVAHDPNKIDFEFLPLGHPLKESGCLSLGSSSTEPDGNNRARFTRAGPGEDPRIQRCLRTNWTPEKFETKISRVTDAIRLSGQTPDLIGLQEVENLYVVTRLAQRLGTHRAISTNSPDRRGIDVAMLFNPSRLQLLHTRHIRINDGLANSEPTRDILRADFRVKNKRMVVFVNHWPSQGHPTERRIFVAQVLRREILQARSEWGRQVAIVVLGDFNTTRKDQPNPISSVLHDPAWSDNLVDSFQLARQQNAWALAFLPPFGGTYYFAPERAWTQLDRILLSRSTVTGESGVQVMPETYRVLSDALLSRLIPASSGQPKPGAGPQGGPMMRVPLRSNPDGSGPQDLGFSDHYPVYIKFRF